MEEQEYLTTEQAKAQIREWKEEYQSVFLTEISEINFVWRGLTRAEYRKAMELFDNDFDRAEYVCSVCVLDPSGVDYSNEIYAGIPETLAQQILAESGFSSDGDRIQELTRQFEDDMKKFENQVSCVIIEAFPYFTLDEIDNWSLDKTLWHFARAKWILESLRGVQLVEEGKKAANGLPADFPIANT